MSERTIKLPAPDGTLIDAHEVPVLESTERWTDIKLEDGSVIRLKSIVLSVARLINRYDEEGNPMYVLKANQVMTVDVPEHLRQRQRSQTKGVH